MDETGTNTANLGKVFSPPLWACRRTAVPSLSPRTGRCFRKVNPSPRRKLQPNVLVESLPCNKPIGYMQKNDMPTSCPSLCSSPDIVVLLLSGCRMKTSINISRGCRPAFRTSLKQTSERNRGSLLEQQRSFPEIPFMSRR